jgi:hypothetical protein
MFRQLLSLIVLRGLLEAAKEVEVLVLRHELAVLLLAISSVRLPC